MKKPPHIKYIFSTQHRTHTHQKRPKSRSGERNSALEAYWQLGEDRVEERVCVQMLEQLMDEPLYDTLRTKVVKE